MSIQAVAWVLEDSESESLDRLVLISLANHANEKWEAWPSVRTISREARISTNTVMAAVRRLVELGELEVLDPGTNRTSARYRILRDSVSDQRRGSETQRLSSVSAASHPGRDAASQQLRDRTINTEPEPTPQPPASGGRDLSTVIDAAVRELCARRKTTRLRATDRHQLVARAETLAAGFPDAPSTLLVAAVLGDPAPNLNLYRKAAS